MGRPSTFDHLVSAKKPLSKVVLVYTDDEVVADYNRARRAAEMVRMAGKATKAELAAAEADLERAQAALDEATVRVRFTSLGRKRYDDLLTQHPPREEDENSPYNPETFPQALIAASMSEPQVTLEEVERIWEEWNSAELMELFTAALEVNTRRRVVEMGKA